MEALLIFILAFLYYLLVRLLFHLYFIFFPWDYGVEKQLLFDVYPSCYAIHWNSVVSPYRLLFSVLGLVRMVILYKSGGPAAGPVFMKHLSVRTGV